MVYCHLDVFTTPLTIPVMRTRLPWLTMKQRPVTYFSKTLCWRLPWGLFRWGVWEYRWSHKGAEWVGKLRVDSISGDLRCHGFWILFWGWGIGLNLGRGLLLDSSIMPASSSWPLYCYPHSFPLIPTLLPLSSFAFPLSYFTASFKTFFFVIKHFRSNLSYFGK